MIDDFELIFIHNETRRYLLKHDLVTGEVGLLGSHLCKKLLETKHEVLSVDNCYTVSKQNISHIQDNYDFELNRYDVTFHIHVEVDEIYNLARTASPSHDQNDIV